MSEEGTITSKGQLTIPKEIRDHFGWKDGEKIIFLEREGELAIKPKIKDPVKKLHELRKQIRFSEKEIDSMIKESKKAWD
ncbi:MAG: AbrB/MazE/SpoVT family DNA-binding domain-containing protein [Candidatus Aenigmatarchaeota archaeon]